MLVTSVWPSSSADFLNVETTDCTDLLPHVEWALRRRSSNVRNGSKADVADAMSLLPPAASECPEQVDLIRDNAAVHCGQLGFLVGKGALGIEKGERIHLSLA